ncbi:hypothetical protein ICW40_05815, partial [Actinotalea ferrariae]|uniref:hypothetical protein n=1 Tax=Actinotalea ferrariae TaxID=1386098 RepID=UPI001C8C5C67
MRLHAPRTILVALLSVLALVAAPMTAAAHPASTSSMTGAGAWVTVAPTVAWGGSSGTQVAGGQARVVTLSPGRQVPVDAAALVVQVQVTGASAAGELALWAAGAPQPADAAVAFPAGASSSTALVVTDA